MKRFLTMIMAVAMLLGVAGCEKDSPVVKSGLSGEWKLVSWNNTTPQAFDIYMEFFSDGKFNLYQKLATSTYRHLTGTFDSKGDVLTGKYDDGAGFADKYSIALEVDVLTLTSTTNPASVSVYKRTTIPDEVRNSPQTKASAEEAVRPL